MKIITLILVSLFAAAAHSHKFPPSKNPRDWDPGIGTCEPELRGCVTITSLEEVPSETAEQLQRFMCLDVLGNPFDCTLIVEKHGTQIIGASFQILQDTVDMCKIPGACGFCKPRGPVFTRRVLNCPHPNQKQSDN